MTRFRELRKKANLTQEELIAQFNARYGKKYTAAAISQFEHDKRIPATESLKDFAEFFGVSIDYLLGRDTSAAPAPAEPPAGLTARDERDIERRLQAIRDDIDRRSVLALLGDHPLTEDEKEQLLIPIKSGLETARLIAKKKFTPKKYQNGAAQRQNDTATRIGKKVLNASPEAQAAVSDIIRGDEKDK